MQTGLRSAAAARPGGAGVAVLGHQEALPRPWHVTELGARVPRVCEHR